MSRSHCVIVARSARALAASATRAGYHVHAIDAFADADVEAKTRQRCHYNADGFDEAQLRAQLSVLAQRYPQALLVVGSGLELQHQLPAMAAGLAVRCNSSDTLACITDPFRFSATLKQAGWPVIPVYNEIPPQSGPILCKRIGGMGGEHIRWASPNMAHEKGYYYQAYIEGAVHSVVFIADGSNVVVVGYNTLWLEQHCPEQPFLLAGACSVQLPAALPDRVESLLRAIVVSTGLMGLCGMDFVITASNEVLILEINPRPPATFELHESEQSLFAAHIKAFEHSLEPYHRCDQQRAYVIIYAPEEMCPGADFDWPVWTRDRPAAGTQFKPCQPICTVHAEAATSTELMDLINYRKQLLCAQLQQHAE